MVVIVSLEKTGNNGFKATAPAGAPFTMTLPVSVTNGSIDGGATTLRIPVGAVESGAVTVTRTAGTTAAVTADIGPSLPAPPPARNIDRSIGYALAKAPGLPLEVVPELVAAPQINGVPQVGNALEVSFAEPPNGALVYQWLRESEVIAGAAGSTYVPTVADVGARLSVRVESGGHSIMGAATAPVWPTPANPPLADGEEELLSATITLGMHQFPYWVAGYGRVRGESFGEMDLTSFEDGGATYVIDAFLVNPNGVFALATGSALPDASGLVAYWNGYRIGLEVDTGNGGKLPMLVGRTPQPNTEYSRYADGASDGIRVAVSLRRAGPPDDAPEPLTASFEGMQIDGVPQVGNALGVSFAEPPNGALVYQWLRGSEVIAGAAVSTYVPTVADVGARLSVRVESGGHSIMSAATAPVWPTPANPPLADGEEELLSATITLGMHQFPYWVAGYGRVRGESFGEMDLTSFEDGGATYVIDAFLVNSNGVFALAAGSALPDASGLVAYWNGYRIGLEVDTGNGGKLPMLVGRTPQPNTEYSRYADGASDGIRVAVSLRRAGPPDDAPEPLTASFEGMPAELDGERAFSFRVAFSEDIGISFRALREDAFTVTGGQVARGRRVDGRRDLFEITVEPDSNGDVTITLPAGRECAVSGAICTKGENRRKLTNTPTVTVRDPAAVSVSVADARVREAAGATLDFAVTLSWAASAAVKVSYATADGTAAAGSDYTARSGTLTFDPGETAKTVRVTVLDDAHDEGNEKMALVLYRASGAIRDDYLAVGMIENTDPMPKAWLARFGRAASDHVVEAIAGRWRDGESRTPPTHFTLGGRQVQGMDSLFGGWDALGAAFNPTGADTANPALMDESNWARMDRKAEALAGGSLADDSFAGRSPAGGNPEGGSSAGRSPARSVLMNSLGLPAGDLRDVLMGSSFFYSRPLDEHGEQPEPPGWLGQWSAWGQTAATRFSGADGPLSLNGEVATAILGVDSRWDRWLAGVTLSHSEGEGAYTHPQAAGGGVSSRLTSLNPYVHYRFNGRTNLWGVLGYGVGGLTLTPDSAGSGTEPGIGSDRSGIQVDLATTMAAFGGRGVLSVRSGRAGAFELAIVSDALVTNTVSEAAQNLMGAAGATSRLRLMLEGSGSMPLGAGGVLRPVIEAGLRYDGGDAETGAGLEVGAGLGYAAGQFAVEVNARALAAHEDTEYEEWGFSGSIRYRPRSDGRGLSMNLGSAWGATESGVQSLWTRQDASGLARGGAALNAGQRFQAELGYGLGGPRGRGLWMPFLGAESARGGQSLRMGFRLTSGPNVEMGLELGRRENGRDAPEHAMQLRGAVRF